MGKKLTKSNIESIPVPEPAADGRSRYTLTFEESTPGFGVRTTSRGVKSFIWQGRVNGRKQRLTIGRFGPLTVDQARRQARKIAGEVASGEDPRAERQRRRVESVTLREAFKAYLEARDLKPNTVRDVERSEKLLSDWLSRPITEITREMVAKRHRKLGRSSPAVANRTMRYLRAVLNFASEAFAHPDGRPLLADNPVSRLSATRAWFRVNPRRTYLRPHELPKWMNAVQGLPEPPERDPGAGWQLPKLKTGEIARDLLMVLVLTGLRRSEALDLRWENVDFDGRTLTIQDPKNREPHTLPLSDYLLELLKRRRESSKGSYVFANEGGQRFASLRFAIDRVEKVSGVRATCHDLRRTFATVAESLDIPAYAVKGLLNHKTSGDVTAGYIQITPERLRQPMQRITDYFLKVGGIRQSDSITQLLVDPRKVAGER